MHTHIKEVAVVAICAQGTQICAVLCMMYLWLAETSQQPISQTTWLKVNPQCNHLTIVMVVDKGAAATHTQHGAATHTHMNRKGDFYDLQ